MKIRWLLVLLTLALVAPPALADTLNTGGAAWHPFVSPTGTGSAGTPYWDTRSWDGASCNVGFWVTNGSGCDFTNFYRNTPDYRGPSPSFFLGDGTTSLTFTADSTSSLTGVSAGTGVSDLASYTEFGWFNLENRDDRHAMVISGVEQAFAVPSGDYGFYASIAPNPVYYSSGALYFSDTQSMNGRSQFAIFNLGITANGEQRYAFGFEDLVGPSDYDYNDVMGVLTYTTSVPEPGSLMLMGMGLVGAGAMLRRRKKV